MKKVMGEVPREGKRGRVLLAALQCSWDGVRWNDYGWGKFKYFTLRTPLTNLYSTLHGVLCENTLFIRIILLIVYNNNGKVYGNSEKIFSNSFSANLLNTLVFYVRRYKIIDHRKNITLNSLHSDSIAINVGLTSLLCNQTNAGTEIRLQLKDWGYYSGLLHQVCLTTQGAVIDDYGRLV
jgi:hypothetical protein